ncbi:pyocin knob domain-containing protein [Chryseobacterium sp. PET-29]|uniref:pyocin knob domain-containing protein n=1 Tax=Chryseobacterium sp. PET-29 TaxID=2983267 RepID=UPI0021E61210|nr:pyocin knob domain-containing protein [Chryseobacterium sp. PET-29]
MDINYAYYTSAKGYRVVNGTAAQFLKADGSVDNASYIPAGTEINMADKNINFTTGSLSRFENNTRVFNKVYQRLYAGAQTGILSFKFPQATSLATMFDVTIKIFGWNARILGTVRVSFYKFSATVLNSNHKAIIECSDNFPSSVINVGFDASGNVCINIGESNTVWNTYLKVEVERVAAFHQGANFDWSKGWTQTIETDVSTYTQLLSIATEVVATRTWVDQNNTGSVPKFAALLATADLNTFLTPGFYYQHASSNATSARNYPVSLAGCLNIYKTSSTRIVQEYSDLQYGRTWKRIYDGISFSGWLRVWSEIDFNQSNITNWNNSVQQSALSNYYTKSEALNQFVGKNGVETINDTKTFTQSPVIPAGTLDNHAVNVSQLINLTDGFVKLNEPFPGWEIMLLNLNSAEIAGLFDKKNDLLIAAKEKDYVKVGCKTGGYDGVAINLNNGHIGYGGVEPTDSHNHYFNGTIRIPYGIYSESSNNNDVYGGDGSLYRLSHEIAREDEYIRLRPDDKEFIGTANSYATKNRIVKLTLLDGGSIVIGLMPEYQEITVMNVSGNQAKFIVNNTSVNFTIPPKSSARYYMNSNGRIIQETMNIGNCVAS